MNKPLNKLLKWLQVETIDQEIMIKSLRLDSRDVENHDAFIALSGMHHHGIKFALQAQQNGASVIISEPYNAIETSALSAIKIPIIIIDQLEQKITEVAARFYDHPSDQLNIVGITGTNGKTSSAWLLLQAWKHLSVKAAYIGTLGYGTINNLKKLNNTTPPAVILQHILAEFVQQGITDIAMEISSHGLALNRTCGLRLSTAALTNISRDHLDFHDGMDDYANTKKKLFVEHRARLSVINHNDKYGQQWLDELNDLPNNTVCSFGINEPKADLNVTNITLSTKGLKFTLNQSGHSHHISSGLLGHFNVENITLMIAVLKSQHQWQDIVTAIAKFTPVPGRMNTLEQPDGCPLVIVDYAHTPDALEQVLITLQKHQPRELWCVFGCGGDRDTGKRALMGTIAEQYADHIVVTDDNPRHEDQTKIVTDILKGIEQQTATVIHDRQQAIKYAIAKAHRDDVIVIAGKGHENTQQIGSKLYPFDDSAVASTLLREMELCA